jgi:hypothetical protein
LRPENSLDWIASPTALAPARGKTKFVPAIRQWVETACGDIAKYDLILTVQKEGMVVEAFSFPQNKAGLCLGKLKGETLSPAPPYAPYKFRIEVDPTKLVSASGH